MLPKIGQENAFEIISQQLLFSRYLKLTNRTTQFNQKRIEWDVVGHQHKNPCFTVVFPFFTATKTVRVLREYAQGPNLVLYNLVSGGFDQQKHKDIQETAVHELSEEAFLKGGEWVQLLPSGHLGISELKWCTNRFMPFLCLNPIVDESPKPRDEEESIEIQDLTLDELDAVIHRGEMMLPAVQTTLMALKYLRENKLDV
ncbi:hypothetical protein EDD86DRAFT_196539 [Gorgonomyces haynaldii]|nr:hypothetical protein EDD86DRAFT_196539 [Gorgonomyces haynaldii]